MAKTQTSAAERSMLIKLKTEKYTQLKTDKQRQQADGLVARGLVTRRSLAGGVLGYRTNTQGKKALEQHESKRAVGAGA